MLENASPTVLVGFETSYIGTSDGEELIFNWSPYGIPGSYTVPFWGGVSPLQPMRSIVFLPPAVERSAVTALRPGRRLPSAIYILPLALLTCNR